MKNGSANCIRTFSAPEDTIEESLLASGINNEGYTIANKLNELSRQRSRRIANSKFYVKGKILECAYDPQSIILVNIDSTLINNQMLKY